MADTDELVAFIAIALSAFFSRGAPLEENQRCAPLYFLNSKLPRVHLRQENSV